MNILDIFFPKECLGCKVKGLYLCDSCLSKVPLYKNNFRNTTSKTLHKIALEGSLSVWEYCGVVRKGIISLKYKFAYSIAEELGTLAGNELRKYDLPSNSVIVPIPLYKSRENWRGFNQCAKLGHFVAKTLKIEFNDTLLKRTKSSNTQVSSRKSQRALNVKGVFEVNKNVNINKETPILLFDDVITTGSTILEAANTLKENGYKHIWAVSLCRR